MLSTWSGWSGWTRDRENVRAALGWCVAQAAAGDGDATDLGLRLASSMGIGWVLGRAREVQSALLQLLSRPEAAVYPRRPRAGTFRGRLLWPGWRGSFTQANALLEEA